MITIPWGRVNNPHGVTAIVVWDQPTEDVPISGGHVVLDVIEGAAVKAGFDLYRQACNPACDYGFMHVTMLVSSDESKEDDQFELILQASPRRLMGIAPDETDPLRTAEYLWFELGPPARAFAQLKSVGQRMLDMESRAQQDAAHLLAHYYETARIRAPQWPRNARERWQNRHWKREARELMAGLWLTIANIETLERRWDDSLRDLQTEYESVQAFFRTEYEADVRRIRKIDTSTLISAIDQVASGLDSNAIALATALGALGGAVAGAVVGRT